MNPNTALKHPVHPSSVFKIRKPFLSRAAVLGWLALAAVCAFQIPANAEILWSEKFQNPEKAAARLKTVEEGGSVIFNRGSMFMTAGETGNYEGIRWCSAVLAPGEIFNDDGEKPVTYQATVDFSAVSEVTHFTLSARPSAVGTSYKLIRYWDSAIAYLSLQRDHLGEPDSLLTISNKDVPKLNDRSGPVNMGLRFTNTDECVKIEVLFGSKVVGSFEDRNPRRLTHGTTLGVMLMDNGSHKKTDVSVTEIVVKR